MLQSNMAESKYPKLKEWLLARPISCESETLSFHEIEAIIDASLPGKAVTRRSWWGNTNQERYTNAGHGLMLDGRRSGCPMIALSLPAHIGVDKKGLRLAKT
jgi:hypothetical protein